jgi:DNA mismatch repair protein MutS2
MSFSTELLEFDDLKRLLVGYAGSAGGRARVEALEPCSDRAAIQDQLAAVGEAIGYLGERLAPQPASRGAAIRLNFNQIPDVEMQLRILRIAGASLDGPQLLELFRVLTLAGEYRAVLHAVGERYPRLASFARKIVDLRDLVRRFEPTFLPDGSLSDHASPALARIRRELHRQQRLIQESLERFIRDHRASGILQEEFVTIREGRYVVPIAAEHRGRVGGVIHGVSGTGRTVFLEPLETIGLNNRLVELQEEEHAETERILREITEVLREHEPEMAASMEVLAELDCIFAKAAFAVSHNAVIPRLSSETSSDRQRRFVLRQARHPLLEAVLGKQGKQVVPLSFELDEQHRCLLISGPNTGGKTVAIKTAGLLALMAHAAIPVPCAEAEVPLFDSVLADIGDMQSIAQSLSTFSGHLMHIKEMLARVTPRSLVLLDELGGATDPEEGGALGVAILEQFRQSGAFCLASTHLLPLKVYGADTPGVVNGSMGFDKATLQPTYELRLGIPGKSFGLDIAARLEMPAPVLERARAVLPRMQVDFENLLAKLHEQVEEYARLQRQLAEAQRELDEKTRQLAEQAARREEQRRREWERTVEKLIADFEAKAEAAINRLTAFEGARKALEQAQRWVARTRREMREQAASAMPAETLSQNVQPAIREGMRVRLKDVREPATVRRLLKNGMLEVEARNLRMHVPPEDVVEILAKEGEVPIRRTEEFRFEQGPPLENYREINLIGQRASDAIEQVDKFLDSAVLASVSRVRIIHGHGMGVLKKAVSEHLARNPHVSRYYPAEQAEGGAGATIVELRE